LTRKVLYLVFAILLCAELSASAFAGEAQETAPTAANAPAPGMTTARFLNNTLMFMVAGFVGYYFLVTRPLVQKEDQQQKLVSSLKKNDSVVVSPGILGKVVQIQENEVTVEISSGVKIRVLASAIEAAPVKPAAAA